MPHATIDVENIHTAKTVPRKSKTKSKSPYREQQQLNSVLSNTQSAYTESQLAQNIAKTLASTLRTARVPVTRILSLGLGSVSTVQKGQIRRLKQLAILLAIRENLEKLNGATIEIYAQDPVFTRIDEAFLSGLGITILRTPSGSSLGEASSLVSPSTLIYSPFLTLEAYEQLLLHSDLRKDVMILVGDDFNALREKWPKYSSERAQVEKVMKTAVVRYRRRAVVGEGFWTEEDGTFPMAVYATEGRIRERARM